MKIIIAKKSHSAWIQYMFVTVVGLANLIIALVIGIEDGVPIFLIAALLCIVGGILFVRYLLLPSEIIALTEDNQLILPKGVTIPLEAVTDVSYKRAQAKGFQYRWGKITLETRMGTYKYDFVADCEEVAKHLTRQMYAAKYDHT